MAKNMNEKLYAFMWHVSFFKPTYDKISAGRDLLVELRRLFVAGDAALGDRIDDFDHPRHNRRRRRRYHHLPPTTTKVGHDVDT